MKLTYTSVFSYLRVAVAGTLVLAAVALAVTATKISTPLQQAERPAPKKVDADFFKPGRNAETAIVGESKNPDSSPEVESYLQRAYPDTEISGDATLAAKSGWASLNASAHSPGNWQLIGPSKATYPAVLDPFLFDGAQYVASGRVTAMAIAPNCTTQNCTLYVAAAGGGIWKTTKALAGDQGWQFISGSFGINAIGSILIDPNNPNTIYAGTGEPNASGDSEAGVGVYKSTDGGQTWNLVPDSGKFFQRAIGQMALDNAGNLLVPIASAIRGVSSVTGGAVSSGNALHPLPSRGLYRCNGTTSCTQIFAAPLAGCGTRGSTTVRVDPTHTGTPVGTSIIYVNAFGGSFTGPGVSGGIWRSIDNGVSFQQIFAPADASLNTCLSALERDEFDVTTLPSGATRMYVGAGEGGEAFNPASPQSTFWRSDNANTAATFASFGGAQVVDYCTGQCWYDNNVYTPGGSPDVVYLGGSFSYGQLLAFGSGKSNGRAWLLSTNAGAMWSDLTQDGAPSHADGMHPDQHAITTVPGKPFQAFFGSDGGVVSSDGKFADVSSKCDSRGLSVADTAFCKSLLNRVPNQLLNMNNGLSTLQFQSFSISAQRPKNLLQGGTQDNGTFQYNGSTDVWPQEIYGDGGQSGFMVTNDKLRFNTFTGQANDVNFRDGDPTKWVIATGAILISVEGAAFYPPIIADPHPLMAGSIFQGSRHVWRTTDWGGPRDYLEANCPEFTTSAANPACGDFEPLGGASAALCSSILNPSGVGCLNTGGDLGGLVYGGDRRPAGAGRVGSGIARTPSNTNTAWASTGGGRVFISDNIDNTTPALVVWSRLDADLPTSADPTRFPSSIYIDPTNVHHAWISYSGYNVATPAQPGHVFTVSWSGAGAAMWTDISYNLPDFPIAAVVSDDKTGDLYAASDFGVMKLPFGTTTWVVAGNGLPMVECPGLTINSAARLLYAATHGRGGWSMDLGK